MAGFVQNVRSALPAARCPSAGESKFVLDYIDFVIPYSRNILGNNAPEKADDWFYILAMALVVTIALRDGKITHGPLFDKYGKNRLDIEMAYADHYLQMRADAFNFGPSQRTMLQNSVFNYDQLKVMGMVPKTGSQPVSPATDLSIYWGLKGIENGLSDDKQIPRASSGPRHPETAYREIASFLGAATLIALKAIFDF